MMNRLNIRLSYAIVAAMAFTLGNCCPALFAATNYVDLRGAEIWPYDTWEKAATNIQSAIDAAVDGDVVLVTDGWYGITAQITITNGIEVRSVNGATVTTVGRAGPENHRLFHLGHGNARLNGFTLTNGNATGSRPDADGGAVLMARDATIENCVVSDNTASLFGGGIHVEDGGGLVQHCVVTRNRSGADGGGVFGRDCTVHHSVICNNISRSDGGGVHLGGGGLIENCRVENNIAGRAGGGILARGDVVRNCLIVGNVASNRGGGIGHYIDVPGQFYNCTIVSNWAPMGGGVEGGTLENTILYYNTADNGSNYYAGTFTHCCSAPTPDGTGNTSADPQFLAPANFRLAPASPCIDTGANQSGIPLGDYDLDDAPRIVHGAPDMGAYEYRESLLSISNSGDMVLCLWSVLPDETYRFERSTNLQSAHWIPIYERPGGDSTNAEFFDNNPAGIGFYRAVYLPPQ